MSAPTINRDEWLAALKDAGVPADIEDDQSAVTSSEFGQMLGISHATAHRRLKALVEAGKAVRTTKRVGMYPQPAYRLVKEAAPAAAPARRRR